MVPALGTGGGTTPLTGIQIDCSPRPSLDREPSLSLSSLFPGLHVILKWANHIDHNRQGPGVLAAGLDVVEHGILDWPPCNTKKGGGVGLGKSGRAKGSHEDGLDGRSQSDAGRVA